MKKVAPFLAAAALVIILCLVMAGTYLIKKYTPSKETADLEEYFHLVNEDDMAIVLGGEQMEEMALWTDGRVYLEYTTIHDRIDDRYYWDKNESKLLYTTPETTFLAEPQSSDYYIGTKKTAGDYGEIVKLIGDSVYISLDYIKVNTALSYETYEAPNRVVIEYKDRQINVVTIKKDTQVRYRGGIKSDILTEVKKDDQVTLISTGEKWAEVQTKDGYRGYIKKGTISKDTTSLIDIEEKEVEYVHEYADEMINTAWHQVSAYASNDQISSVLSQTKGVNVISPTWFYLNDSKGSIASLASSDYVNYCHSQGVEVWGLVSNLEDSSVDTTQVLTTTTYRENLVSAIISKAIEYKLDGINVDIEALNPEVGDGYIQFIRELSLKCHDNGLTLSVDNYVPTDYTAFYRRQEQANYADYIVIMAYDEHYAGSDAGSVSSIGFVRSGVENTLKEVPANQIILGLPFYTRVWELTPQTTDEGDIIAYDTKSQAIGMQTASNMAGVNGITPVWDEASGQYYVEYENSGKIYQIWMEEEESLELKLNEVTNHQLAGVSFWKLGFERSNVWNVIIKHIH